MLNHFSMSYGIQSNGLLLSAEERARRCSSQQQGVRIPCPENCRELHLLRGIGGPADSSGRGCVHTLLRRARAGGGLLRRTIAGGLLRGVRLLLARVLLSRCAVGLLTTRGRVSSGLSGGARRGCVGRLARRLPVSPLLTLLGRQTRLRGSVRLRVSSRPRSCSVGACRLTCMRQWRGTHKADARDLLV